MSSVADALTLAASFEEAILDLKATGRDDHAGVRNRRPIRTIGPVVSALED
jgi:hypothetical protein